MTDAVQEYLLFFEGMIPKFLLGIITALLIFIIGKWLVKRVTKISSNLMEKANVDPTLSKFLASVVNIALLGLVIIAALSHLGVETSSFVAIFGAAALAVGFALKDSLGNFAAGVMIILFKPFKVGNFISGAGEMGTVEKIEMFATTLNTPDNKVITIPNSNLIGGNITNFSLKETRRVDLTFGIGYGDDLKKAKNILVELANADERILKEPAPFVAVSELADSSVNFVMRVWVNAPDFWSVNFSMIENVKTKFDEEGISIPFPQTDVHLFNKN